VQLAQEHLFIENPMDRMKKSHCELPFKVGDLVYLSHTIANCSTKVLDLLKLRILPEMLLIWSHWMDLF
jgi:hypothetical protein